MLSVLVDIASSEMPTILLYFHWYIDQKNIYKTMWMQLTWCYLIPVKNMFWVVDNNNISIENLWQVGLHLNGEGANVLTNNFTKFLNVYILWDTELFNIENKVSIFNTGNKVSINSKHIERKNF